MRLPEYTLGITITGENHLAGPVVLIGLVLPKNTQLTLPPPKDCILYTKILEVSELSQKEIRTLIKREIQVCTQYILQRLLVGYITTFLLSAENNYPCIVAGISPCIFIPSHTKHLPSIIQESFSLGKKLLKSYYKECKSIYPHISFSKHLGKDTPLHRKEIANKQNLTPLHRIKHPFILQKLQEKPTLLLHVCCGPDACIPFLDLKDQFTIIAYFYNPNIHPKEEYIKRYDAFKKVCDIEGVQILDAEYIPKDFFDAIKGLEHTPERGEKCHICYEMRIRHAALKAKEVGADVFTTSLFTSPKKKFDLLAQFGIEEGNKIGIPFLIEAFRKNDGFNRSVEYTKKHDIYRQNYCGCIYSLPKKLD